MEHNDNTLNTYSLYKSFSTFLYEKECNYDNIKLQIINYVINHWTEFEDYIKNNYYKNTSKDNYYIKMLTNDYFEDEIEIISFNKIYNTYIIVDTDTSTSNFGYFNPKNMIILKKQNITNKIQYTLHYHKNSNIITLPGENVNYAEEINIDLNCSLCNNNFRNLDEFNLHLNTHNRKICPKCGNIITKNHLARHIKAHDSEKKYNCPDCSKSFYRKTHLNRHADIHNEITYRCLICNQNIIRKDNFERHMNKKHPVSAINH